MANEHKIEVNKRDGLGKKEIRQLRRESNIPGIYYSSNSKESTPIYISNVEFNNALKSGARIFNISVAGKKQNVFLKNLNFDGSILIENDGKEENIFSARIINDINWYWEYKYSFCCKCK